MNDGITEVLPMDRKTWTRILGIVAPVTAVLAVHGTNLSYPLFYDDFTWLAVPDHEGWFLEALTFRPVLALWFAGMRPLFGISSLPYHLFALVFLAAAALSLRWLALNLGLGNLAATASGVLYGAFAALTLTTMWVSTAVSPLAVALAVASVALLYRPSPRRRFAAAALLATAILLREVTIVTPALATLVIAAQSPGRPIVSTVLRRTSVLWVVGGAYLAIRALFVGFGGGSGPYAIDLWGAHLLENLITLMATASRFGLPPEVLDEIGILWLWHTLVWLSIFGAAAWAAIRRGAYLPAAGIACFFVALVPMIILPNHPMDPYYLDLAAVGLALTLGSLISLVRLAPAATAVAVAVGIFVLVQAVTVQLYQERSYFDRVFIPRTEVLRQIAATERPSGGELLVVTRCPLDREISRTGDLFRVVLDEPELRVRFEVVEPKTCE